MLNAQGLVVASASYLSHQYLAKGLIMAQSFESYF
jgi:hypothetical protein